ncbi:hypothetical protein [Algoriphagus confluentis]|uniref:DUF3575 domain-containing protein n=1 Tax=Algoriphagus confluentis TaxID=1697556 RepID=A0ABQ6PUJ0_9BACT|nr:hypothetical protein Aconfl_36030 [Algoriphagus confluentis]
MTKIQVLLFIGFFFLTSLVAQGQDTTSNQSHSKFDIGLEGMIGVSFGRDFYSMNVGGPSLFLILGKDLKLGVGALPSLYLLEGKLGARLGVAPRIDYKNMVFFAPFFHRDKTEEWIASVGFGYKFHRKKSS